MTIERPKYIEQLMNARGNGLVKIVTGIRRCGKSFLLSTLFVDELKKAGNSEDNIMSRRKRGKRRVYFQLSTTLNYKL